MIRITAVLFLASLVTHAQNFQPPSWGQGQGQGQGQGAGQGQAQGQGLQQQINQLQSQIDRLRAQQRLQSQPHVEAQTGPVLGHPVSGTETRRTTQTLMDGTEVNRSDTSYFYRDAAGRMRDESPNRVEIFDTVGHAEYDMTPAKKTYDKSPLSGNEEYISVAVFGNSSNTASCSGHGCENSMTPDGTTEDLGQQKVNGLMAKGSRVTITIPVGAVGNNREIKVVNERWYSDELQVLIKSINTDPRFGVNVYEFTDIKQTNPPESLFEPPSDYTFVKRVH